MRRRLKLLVGLLLLVSISTVLSRAFVDSGIQNRTPANVAELSIAAKRRAWQGTPMSNGRLTLQGIVVDENERPVSDAEVSITPGAQSFVTSSDGKFLLDRLAPRKYGISASSGTLYSSTVYVDTSGYEGLITLRMRQGLTLVVTVIGDRNRLEAATVVLDGRTAVLSGADGKATLVGIPPGYHELEVFAKGWAPTMRWMRIGDDPGGIIESEVVLRRGSPVEGSVIDESNRPVGHAEVVFSDVKGQWVATATSDGKGRWRIDALESGTFDVAVTSPEYLSNETSRITHDGILPKRDLVLRVGLGGEISGTVRGSDGELVAGAEVSATLHGVRTHYSSTDLNGKFNIRGLSSGRYIVEARADKHASEVPVEVLFGQRSDVDLVLESSVIGGSVSDNSVGAAGVRVIAWRVDARSATNIETLTGSKGAFLFSGLTPGEYMVYAAHPDEKAISDNPRGVRVRTGDVSVKLELGGVGTLVGRVLVDGKQQTHFGILLMRPEELPGSGRQVTGVRDPNGAFIVSEVQTGTWSVGLISQGASLKVINGVEIRSGQTVDLGDINLERGTRLSGRVTDSGGHPVPGARVTISSAFQEDATQFDKWVTGQYETRSDESGRYRFEGISSHIWRYHLPKLAATEYSRGLSRLRTLSDDDESIDIELLPYGSLRGQISSLSDGIVQVFHNSESPDSRVTPIDELGRFSCERIPVGDYFIRIEVGGRMHEWRTIVKDAQMTEILLSIPNE